MRYINLHLPLPLPYTAVPEDGRTCFSYFILF